MKLLKSVYFLTAFWVMDFFFIMWLFAMMNFLLAIGISNISFWVVENTRRFYTKLCYWFCLLLISGLGWPICASHPWRPSEVEIPWTELNWFSIWGITFDAVIGLLGMFINVHQLVHQSSEPTSLVPGLGFVLGLRQLRPGYRFDPFFSFLLILSSKLYMAVTIRVCTIQKKKTFRAWAWISSPCANQNC